MMAPGKPLVDPASGRPLHVLVTRPSGQAEETASLVHELGGTALVAPCLRLAPPEDPDAARAALLRALDGKPQAIAFASTNAVHATCRLLGESLAPLAVPGLILAAVGPQTARALTSHGLSPTLIADGGTGAALATALAQKLGLEATGAEAAAVRVVLPRAEESRTELEDGLHAAGYRLETCAVYRMLPATPAELTEAVAALVAGAVDLVPLGSPRTAATLLGALGDRAGELLRKPVIGAIGETTRAALHAAGVEVAYALSPPAVSFRALLIELAAAYHRREQPVRPPPPLL